MSAPGSARELLIAEAIGDVVKLLDRTRDVVLSLEATRDEVLRASLSLQTKAASIDGRIAMLADAAKVHVLQHVAKRTEEMTRSAAERQSETMEALARTLFDTELRAALQRLGQFLDARIARRELQGTVWTHLAVAAFVATASYALAIHLATG